MDIASTNAKVMALLMGLKKSSPADTAHLPELATEADAVKVEDLPAHMDNCRLDGGADGEGGCVTLDGVLPQPGDSDYPKKMMPYVKRHMILRLLLILMSWQTGSLDPEEHRKQIEHYADAKVDGLYRTGDLSPLAIVSRNVIMQRLPRLNLLSTLPEPTTV